MGKPPRTPEAMAYAASCPTPPAKVRANAVAAELWTAVVPAARVVTALGTWRRVMCRGLGARKRDPARRPTPGSLFKYWQAAALLGVPLSLAYRKALGMLPRGVQPSAPPLPDYEPVTWAPSSPYHCMAIFNAARVDASRRVRADAPKTFGAQHRPWFSKPQAKGHVRLPRVIIAVHAGLWPSVEACFEHLQEEAERQHRAWRRPKEAKPGDVVDPPLALYGPGGALPPRG